jgi:hypothetical protein
LKRIITEDTLPIEPKFVDLELHPNCLHIIMLSNKEWVVPAAINARRFAVFDVSDKYRGNKEYFVPPYQEIENGGAAAMLYDLLRMDLKGWHPRDDVPKTTALRDQKILSLPGEDQWWFGLIESGTLPDEWNGRAPKRKLYDAARKNVPGLRYSSDVMLGKALRKRGCRDCRMQNNAPALQFPDLTEARKQWDEKLPGTEWAVEVDKNGKKVEWAWGDDDPM